jgi:hypothetical protein
VINRLLRSFVIANFISPPFQIKSLCLASNFWQRLSVIHISLALSEFTFWGDIFTWAGN